MSECVDANQFARQLLMPEPMVADFLAAKRASEPLRYNTVLAFSMKFEVPHDQAVIRLTELGYDIGLGGSTHSPGKGGA